MPQLSSIRAKLLGENFEFFTKFAFKKTHGKSLGEQEYLKVMMYSIASVINRKTRRLLINLPPQHLKSFVGTVCLGAFLLGIRPQLRILLLAYNDEFAASLASKIRDIMQTDWYREIFPT